MAAFRILHVDDEPDIREVVELSLSVDPGLTLRSCGSGKEALAAAAEWLPDLVLCDVMMPGMDGPATLARLRANPATARIPVVFMTARLQASELRYFVSLGASGVIAKPFNALTLCESTRAHLRAAKLADMSDAFGERLRGDAVTLAEYRAVLSGEPSSPHMLRELQGCAHKLAGAAGVFGYRSVSAAASALEDSVIERTSGRGTPGDVETQLDLLICCLADDLADDAALPSPGIIPDPDGAFTVARELERAE